MVFKLNLTEPVVRREKIIESNIDLVGREVKDILHFINNSYNRHIEDDILFELRVVLNELMVNAVIHGNKNDSSKHIKISYGITERNNVFFTVEDDGEGYDYKFLLDGLEESTKTIAFENLRDCGRGILIVKGLCEKMEFNQKGNRIFIMKCLLSEA